MQIQADYRNSNINRYNYMNNLSQNNVSFEGINFGRLYSRKKHHVSPEVILREYTHQIVNYLGLNFEETALKIKGLDSESKEFLKKLSRRYSHENFNLAGNLKEDPQLVFDVLNKIKHPKDYHYSVVSEMSGNFGFISKVLSSAQDKTSMEFALDFQEKLIKNHPSSKNMLIEMLNSPFKKQYITNINDYKSYIILNEKNPEAIKELDLLMQNQQYDRKVYDTRLIVNDIFDYQNLFRANILTKENLEKYYSKQGIKFLEKIISSYNVNKDFKLSANSEAQILEMYKTTNKQNIDSRLDFIDKYKYRYMNSKESADDGISAMKKLFELMDSDKNAMKFINKVSTTTSVKFDSIQQLYQVLKELTPRKVNLFSNNVFRIVRRVEGEELIPTLKAHYNNPFFETKESKRNMEELIKYRFKRPEPVLSKFKRAVLNKISEFRLAIEEKQASKRAALVNTEEIISEKPQVITPEIKPVIIEEKPIKPIIAEEKPQIKEVKSSVIEEKPIIKQEITEEKTIKPAIAEEKPIVEQKVPEKVENAMPFEWNTQKALPLKIKLTNTVKESPKARKLRLIGEVNEFISKKLSAKTVEKQGDIYGKNATKMRLKMLPEIFASIKETRQTDRAVGKFKSISANKDAVDLYRLINGSNRKYIKYLLEKRNVDGTRMFEVKDIIAMVEKANKRVDAMKKSNPDFKAKDAKAYFDHLYDAKIEQYGKVKRTKKK